MEGKYETLYRQLILERERLKKASNLPYNRLSLRRRRKEVRALLKEVRAVQKEISKNTPFSYT